MPSKYTVQPLDLDGLDTYPLASRESKVGRDQLGKAPPSSASFSEIFGTGFPISSPPKTCESSSTACAPLASA